MTPKRQHPLLMRFSALARLARSSPRRRIPVVKQLTPAESSAAVLSMVLKYYGKDVPLGDLKVELGGRQDGRVASDLLRVGRAHGLRGREIRVDLGDVKRLPIGAVLFWKYNQVVVWERSRRSGVEIVDPAIGRRTVSIENFKNFFTGVVLIFDPTESFNSEGRKRKRLSRLLGLISSQKHLLARIVSTSVMVQLLSASIPLLTGLVIDRVIPHRDYSLLLTITVGYSAFELCNAAAVFIRAHLLIYLRARLEATFTLNFVDHLADLPYQFFQRRTAGDLMVRLGSNNVVRNILTSTVLSALLDGSIASIYLALLLLVDFRLTVVVLLLAVARFSLLALLWWRQRLVLAESIDNESRAQTYQIEMLGGMETLKAMGLEHRAVEKWSNIFVDGLNISMKRGRLDALFEGLIALVGIANSLAFLFYGAFLVLNGELTLGSMMAFGGLAGGFLGPLNNLVGAALQLQMLQVHLDTISDVLETSPEQPPNMSFLCSPLKGSVSLQNVSFAYAEGAGKALEDVSFEVRPGAWVALVGRSGSGKSTLARLVAGLCEPNRGRILFDGNDLKCLDRRSVRKQIGVVTQDTQLFGGSIRTNIALGDPDMNLAKVIRAAKLAGLHDEIIAMPMGYETHLADRGLSLSGGQRQRLAIARALARDPQLLILDEATSHLDEIVEGEVNRNLASLRCTRILIAHRLNTIREADAILVLEAGRVVGYGPHEQLLKVCPAYALLFGIHQDRIETVKVDGQSDANLAT